MAFVTYESVLFIEVSSIQKCPYRERSHCILYLSLTALKMSVRLLKYVGVLTTIISLALNVILVLLRNKSDTNTSQSNCIETDKHYDHTY